MSQAELAQTGAAIVIGDDVPLARVSLRSETDIGTLRTAGLAASLHVKKPPIALVNASREEVERVLGNGNCPAPIIPIIDAPSTERPTAAESAQ